VDCSFFVRVRTDGPVEICAVSLSFPYLCCRKAGSERPAPHRRIRQRLYQQQRRVRDLPAETQAQPDMRLVHRNRQPEDSELRRKNDDDELLVKPAGILPYVPAEGQRQRLRLASQCWLS
jgi:hypothetical protein